MTAETHKFTGSPEEQAPEVVIPLSELIAWQNDQVAEVNKLKTLMNQRLGEDIVSELNAQDAFQLGKIALGETLLDDFSALLEGLSNTAAGNLDNITRISGDGPDHSIDK
jgi:hypothetical protein